jgi:hypothetical protein
MSKSDKFYWERLEREQRVRRQGAECTNRAELAEYLAVRDRFKVQGKRYPSFRDYMRDPIAFIVMLA